MSVTQWYMPKKYTCPSKSGKCIFGFISSDRDFWNNFLQILYLCTKIKFFSIYKNKIIWTVKGESARANKTNTRNIYSFNIIELCFFFLTFFPKYFSIFISALRFYYSTFFGKIKDFFYKLTIFLQIVTFFCRNYHKSPAFSVKVPIKLMVIFHLAVEI